MRAPYFLDHREQMNKTFLKNRSAQTLIEYTIVIGIIVLVMFAMNPMIKRGIQSLVRAVADQVGNQEAADQDFETGHLEASYSTTRADITEETKDQLGIINYIPDETVFTDTQTELNLGFTKTK